MMRSGIDTDLLEQVVARLPRDAFSTSREAALARFRELGFPDTRQEEWKYTSLAAAAEVSNRWMRRLAEGAAADSGLPPEAQELVESVSRAVDAHWIVIANGIVQPASLAALDLPGVQAATVAEAAEALPLAGDALSLFNTALLRDALTIRLAPGATVERPIGLLVIDAAPDGHAVSLPRVIVQAGANAAASFVEVHASVAGGELFTNALVEVALAPGAGVSWLRIQQRAAGHCQVARLNASLARDASFKHAAVDLGGGLVRNDIAADIREPGASVTLHGLYLADRRQHIDNHTRVDHRVGPAESSEEYRGILNDRARCVFNGKALVHPGADGTDARQANHNLLLSAQAEVDTKPELEIYADDVKCSHGATVGQLDQNAVFYLRTRGLTLHEAAQALTRAFATAIVARCPVEQARGWLERAVEARLEELVVADPAGVRPEGEAEPGNRR